MVKKWLIALMSLPFALHAQDKIYKRDGSIVESKVKAVGTGVITYKRFEKQTGPDFSIPVRDVERIVYENGYIDNFPASHSHRGHVTEKGSDREYTKVYGSNIFTFVPAAYTFALEGTINDPGIGLSYERLLDAEGHFGFTLPVVYSFAQNKNYNNNYYYYSSSYTFTGPNNHTSLSFMPGVKFYPAREQRKVRYGLGVSFFATFGSEPYDVYDRNFGAGVVPGTRGDWKYTMYGAAISNTVNITLARNFFMELGVNGCVPFADNRFRDQSDFTNVFSPIGQFVMKAGARF